MSSLSKGPSKKDRALKSFFRSRIIPSKEAETPVVRLVWSEAGLLKLPIEIWQRIFELTIAAVWYSGNEFWVPASTRNYLACEVRPPTLDLDEDQQRLLFSMRRNLVMVCKSWYFMAISTLWSHVRIIVHDHLKTISETLDNTPALAPYVRRLTIWIADLGISPYNSKLMAKVVRQLRRVEFVSLPQIQASRRTGYGFVLRYEKAAINEDSAIQEDSSRPRIAEIKVRGSSVADIMGFDGFWDVKSARVLSVWRGGPIYWKQALNMFVSLEKLELLIDKQPVYASGFNIAKFPRLKTLCLAFHAELNGEDSVQPWLDYIRAPCLHRFTLHLTSENSVSLEPTNRDYLLQKVDAAIIAYPSLRVIGMFTETARIIARGGKEGILLKSDIDDWCKRDFVVEISRGYEHDRRTYRK